MTANNTFTSAAASVRRSTLARRVRGARAMKCGGLSRQGRLRANNPSAQCTSSFLQKLARSKPPSFIPGQARPRLRSRVPRSCCGSPILADRCSEGRRDEVADGAPLGTRSLLHGPQELGLQSRRHLNGGAIAALILSHGIYSGDHASGVPRANRGRDAPGRTHRLARRILIPFEYRPCDSPIGGPQFSPAGGRRALMGASALAIGRPLPGWIAELVVSAIAILVNRLLSRSQRR
jgi:hypothetical protein